MAVVWKQAIVSWPPDGDSHLYTRGFILLSSLLPTTRSDVPCRRLPERRTRTKQVLRSYAFRLYMNRCEHAPPRQRLFGWHWLRVGPEVRLWWACAGELHGDTGAKTAGTWTEGFVGPVPC